MHGEFGLLLADVRLWQIELGGSAGVLAQAFLSHIDPPHTFPHTYTPPHLHPLLPWLMQGDVHASARALVPIGAGASSGGATGVLAIALLLIA